MKIQIKVAVSRIVLTLMVVSSAAAEMVLACQQTKGVVTVTTILLCYYIGLSVSSRCSGHDS